MMHWLVFLTWSRYSLIYIFAILLLIFVLSFPIKRYFLRKYDPEFRDEFDAIYSKDAETGNLRFGYYLKGMTLPNMFTHEIFARKSIKKIASLPDRAVAYLFLIFGFVSVVGIFAWYIPYLCERMEIVDLGLGHWGPQGRLDSGGFGQILIDAIIDYAAWVIHSPVAAIVAFVIIVVSITIYRAWGKRGFRS